MDAARNLYEAVKCDLCGSDRSVTRYRIDTDSLQLARVWVNGAERQLSSTETIVQCQNCQLAYTNPRLVASAGVVAYSFEQELLYFEQTRGLRRRAYHRLLRQIVGWLKHPPSSVLDVGCGDGVLLECAHELGIQATGLEVSPQLVELVRKRLGAGAITDQPLSELPPESYEVVALINVIEHVRRPSEILRSVYRVLRPGGVIVIHTPNFGGLPARLAGARWHQIEPYAHFYYFDAHTLTQLLNKSGFRRVEQFGLVASRGLKALAQIIIQSCGIYWDNGLGLTARRPAA